METPLLRIGKYSFNPLDVTVVVAESSKIRFFFKNGQSMSSSDGDEEYTALLAYHKAQPEFKMPLVT